MTLRSADKCTALTDTNFPFLWLLDQLMVTKSTHFGVPLFLVTREIAHPKG